MPYNAARGGHAPGHLRDAFLDWLDDSERVEVVVGWNEERKPLSWLFGQLWNCNDILPSAAYEQVRELLEGSDFLYRATGEPELRRTYAAAVRRLARLAA